MSLWKSWKRRWRQDRVRVLQRMVWRNDRMCLDDLVFRLEHERNNNWELGENCFCFYKVKSLIDEFAKFFSTCRAFEVRNALELGIWDGGSLAFWREVLQPDKLVGIDNMDRSDSDYFRRYLDSRRLHDRLRTYWKTDQRDAERLRQIVATEFDSPLDLVLDDASHTYEGTRASFETLFPLLRPGGLYIIEDWAWGHWPEHNGPTHPFANDVEPTRLIEELVHALGSSQRTAPVVSRLTIHEGFTVVERGPQVIHAGSTFRLEPYIIRRPTLCKNAG